MKMMKQPPNEMVRNRLIRPSPVVLVSKGGEGGESGMCVEVSLVGAVNREDFSRDMEGEKVEAVGQLPAMVSFKRLKITMGTSKRGQAYQLKFVLKQYLNIYISIVYQKIREKRRKR